MLTDNIVTFLGISSLINIGLLLYWFFAFLYAHDLIYRLHTRWFKLSVEKFDSIHYSGMAILKLVTLFFNVVPYIVLKIML